MSSEYSQSVTVCVFVCVCAPSNHRDPVGLPYVFQQGVQAVVSWPWTNEDGLTFGEARRDAFLCTCSFTRAISFWTLLVTRTRHPAFASVHPRQMCIVALDLSIWS